MGFKVDGNIKLDINFAMTVTVTILLFFQNQGLQHTNNAVADVQANVQDVKVDSKETKETIKVVNNDTKQTIDVKVKKINDKLNTLGNTTKLSDAQLLNIAKQILREVN